MTSKTILIIVGSFGVGVIVIGIAMMAGAGWVTPGQYTGTHNAANKVTDSKNCYSFQTGCKNSNSGTTSSYVAKPAVAPSGSYSYSP